jgi:hypothetical protein
MKLGEKQIHHYVALSALLIGGYAFSNAATLAGRLYGISTSTWLGLSIAVPILHQVYVWLIWRTQLKYSLITRIFGEKGFKFYAVGFTVLFAARLIFIMILSWSNKDSIALNPVFAYALSFVFILLSAYLFYSVRTYFGFKRAYGIDHFDASYRSRPFVRKGIFRFTGNAMYTFGFLILWVPGLVFFSQAALLAAGFNHIYIWVHYYTTELPDIRYIYGSRNH